MWTLGRFESGTETFLQVVQDSTLRPNVFYNLLLQVRGAEVSLDANGVALFTSVRVPDSASGAIGVMARRSTFMIKGWSVWSSSLAETAPRRASSSQPPSGLGGAGVAAVAYDGAPSASESETKRDHHGVYESVSWDERHLTELIERDIIDSDLGVRFDDIAALDTAKRLLKEAVVLPSIVPELFTGIREPWRGVLLFGPPGTGKTLLARAACSMNGSTFFNVSVFLRAARASAARAHRLTPRRDAAQISTASLVSKHRGESEKIIRALFNQARARAPSIIFMDEADALVASRGMGEHEASRRLKTEFLTSMDGISSVSSDTARVMVLAATNTPWDLDDAIIRRLEKRIHIPLPDLPARCELFAINLREVDVEGEVQIPVLATATDGYSGADIHLVCREASMVSREAFANEIPQRERARARHDERASPTDADEKNHPWEIARRDPGDADYGAACLEHCYHGGLQAGHRERTSEPLRGRPAPARAVGRGLWLSVKCRVLSFLYPELAF